jgi:hypothetical protein
VIFKLHPDARTAEYREADMATGQIAEKFSNAVENAIAKIIRRPERFRCDGLIQILTSFAAVRSPPSSPASIGVVPSLCRTIPSPEIT